MTPAQRLRHLLTWPLRVFFDHRFKELESDIDRSQRELARLIDERVSSLLVPLEQATDDLRRQMAATAETLTYIGVELRRLTDAVDDASLRRDEH